MKKLFFILAVCSSMPIFGMLRRPVSLVLARNLSIARKSPTDELYIVLRGQHAQLRADVERKQRIMKVLECTLADEKVLKEKQATITTLTREVENEISNARALSVRVNNELSPIAGEKQSQQTALKESAKSDEPKDEESPEQISRNKFW